MKKILLSCTILVLILVVRMEAQQQLPDLTEKEKKVIVIKKSVDANGVETIEKIIAEGSEADQILKEIEPGDVDYIDVRIEGDRNQIEKEIEVEMVNPDGTGNRPAWHHDQEAVPGPGGNIQVEVEEENGQRTIKMHREGEIEEIIEIKPGEELSDAQKEKLRSQGVHLYRLDNEGDPDAMTYHFKAGNAMIRVDVDEENGRKEIQLFGKNGDQEALESLGYVRMAESDEKHDSAPVRRANCAALGVWVNSGDQGEVIVSGVMKDSGAEKAGIRQHDRIVAIDGHAVSTHGELLEALADYEPGDVVNVKFQNEAEEKVARVELTAWKDLPDMQDSWHAKIDCGDAAYQHTFDFTETMSKHVIIIRKKDDVQPEPTSEAAADPDPNGKQRTLLDNTLQLQDFTAFPNPSDGKFQVRFLTTPGPITVRVLDTSGKEIFTENIKQFDGVYDRAIELKDGITGSFILSVEQGEKIFTEQLIVH